jgi:hypothetical protein
MFTNLPDSSYCLWVILAQFLLLQSIKKLLILSENIVESAFSNMNETPGTIFEVNCQAHWLSDFLFNIVNSGIQKPFWHSTHDFQ